VLVHRSYDPVLASGSFFTNPVLPVHMPPIAAMCGGFFQDSIARLTLSCYFSFCASRCFLIADIAVAVRPQVVEQYFFAVLCS